MGFGKISGIQSYLDKKIVKDRDIKITLVIGGRFVKVMNQYR